MPSNHIEIADNIKSNDHDLRPHFEFIFDLIIKEVPDNCYINREILDSKSLDEYFMKRYPNKKYALLFYAHNPLNPTYIEKNKAHTSLILCHIINDKIDPNSVINIDSYHTPWYVDILGESQNSQVKAQAQKKIKKRIVICSKSNGINTAIQAPSWHNMNCALFAANFAKALLAMITKGRGKIIEDELRSCQTPSLRSSKHFSHGDNPLVTAMIDELMTNQIYFKRNEDNHITFDPPATLKYHTDRREEISKSYTAANNVPIPIEIKNNINNLIAKLNSEIKSNQASCFSFFYSYETTTKTTKRKYLEYMLEAKSLTDLKQMANNAKKDNRIMRGMISTRTSDLINEIINDRHMIRLTP